ncbi:hypothetical protein TRIUR3_16854 [Triticum urartu]|uniref:Uncharacterized protein n=1 Tax=Triticum urartu TaxID=4572 RepID=M7ZNN9_TRIUA|nr:hypothetical protein TRIUR3_16854 [Triticum urartu]
MGEASSDDLCHCQGCLGKYTLLRDEENPQLARCVDGSVTILIHRLIIFVVKLLNSGRAGNSLHHLQFFFFCPDKLSEIVLAAIFTTAATITLSIILIIWAQK